MWQYSPCNWWELITISRQLSLNFPDLIISFPERLTLKLSGNQVSKLCHPFYCRDTVSYYINFIAFIVLHCICCFVQSVWKRKELRWSSNPSFFPLKIVWDKRKKKAKKFVTQDRWFLYMFVKNMLLENAAILWYFIL